MAASIQEAGHLGESSVTQCVPVAIQRRKRHPSQGLSGVLFSDREPGVGEPGRHEVPACELAAVVFTRVRHEITQARKPPLDGAIVRQEK